MSAAQVIDEYLPNPQVTLHWFEFKSSGCGGGGRDGGGRDGGGGGGSLDKERTPQSAQSVPKSQASEFDPGPPSSQTPSGEALRASTPIHRLHVFSQRVSWPGNCGGGGVRGGDDDGGGGGGSGGGGGGGGGFGGGGGGEGLSTVNCRRSVAPSPTTCTSART